MSNSENNIYFTLKIIFSEEYKYFVTITVFDSDSRIVDSQSSNNDEIIFNLARGLYTLRIEMNGVIKDEVTFVKKNKVYQIGDRSSVIIDSAKMISPPKQFSSALLGDSYETSREYYTGESINRSKKETFTLQGESDLSNNSLFIFFRFPKMEIYNELKDSSIKPFYADFEIVDENGTVLINFESTQGVELDTHYGFVSLNATLPQGLYYLIYRGKEARQIPIYVYKNWHTQFFMTLSSQPLFGTSRIFLSRERSFNHNEKSHKHIDILLDKIQNNDLSLNFDFLQEVATATSDSPMLGLICCYMYLQGKMSKGDVLFNTIFQNLKSSIFCESTDSPDLLALNILASNHFPNHVYQEVFANGTPMFRIGYETILNASVKNKNLIPQNSINDFISENLYFDSPYNTFKPVPFLKKTVFKHNIEVIDIFKSQISPPAMPSFEKAMLSPINLNFDHKINIFTFGVDKLYPDELFRYIYSINETQEDSSWIKNSIAEIIKVDKSVSISDISTDLNISPNTVLRIFSDWEKECSKAQ